MDFRQNIFRARNLKLPPLEPSTFTKTESNKLPSPLPWSDYFEEKRTVDYNDTHFNVYVSGLGNEGPIFVLLHGAGHSGLTFGLTAKHIHAADPHSFTVVAVDARAHGDTVGENEENLCLERIVDDLAGVFNILFPDNKRDVVVIGHSMGGAVAARVVKERRITNVLGLVLIDIVEGSAMDSLSAIPTFINARPRSFASIGSAIQWHIDSEAVQNLESARLSVPSLVTSRGNVWTWRTQLLPTEKFWRGWYEGLSQTFVKAPTAKLLILAGTDRLDKELLIAQMQGKFQLELLPAAGHTIQEDLPQRVADLIVSFWKRNQRLNIPALRL
ncbi:protein phosphatase methylesterase [Coemansia reversa NRRL 1564]|uniref:Protein phosphatase methylesterase 1 n=1 Tax=Coemansia reversa (strain ATCC 12441 / NRRL 1564) TaxID=763665 RepID=A0A2G5BE15_COERN|nr:protein phosphatase methylesterase [Coemansia reversa NRRL 1564]|eukprot:PIA17260.1 protein phosphatase methylesterase [Coemansia reversa NRRL 1564]